VDKTTEEDDVAGVGIVGDKTLLDDVDEEGVENV